MLFQGALVDRGSPERPAAYYLVDKAGLAGSGRALEKAIAGGRGPFENVCPWARAVGAAGKTTAHMLEGLAQRQKVRRVRPSRLGFRDG